jgi:hypothetical protein
MSRTRVFRCLAVVTLVASTPFFVGCGLVFGGSRQVIRANSSPDGAKISTVPMTADYTTPASLSFERKNNYTLIFEKEGYKSAKFEIQKHVRGGIVVLDILFGLVPVIVDAATGAWNGLSPDVATVTLEKLRADFPGPEKITVALNFRADKEGTDQLKVDADSPGVGIRVTPR